ncbi:MAG: hypothetical protein GYA24_21835 [Candidatus Lokiarchaeota archaeon]|nr:hypothetical protein [Candidatus Lokiarchaeota archaeon]
MTTIMIAIQKAAWGTVALLIAGPPVIGIGYLLIPVAPGCPPDPWSSPKILLVGGAVAVVLWLLAIAIITWLHKNKATEVLARRSWKAPAGIAFCLLLAGAVMAYTSVEISTKHAELADRQQLLSQNVAVAIYESPGYNAFPKVLALSNGSLWAVWYKANGHVDSNNDGKIVQSFSADNGSSWTVPVVIADDPELDTRNPAIGQLGNGTLVLAYFLYDARTRRATRCDWISSNDGASWSSPREINATSYNPVGQARYAWLSPFGNMLDMGGRHVAAFYGGPASAGEEGNEVVLLEFSTTNSTWRYHAMPMGGGSGRGYNEANIQWTGDRWLCVARSSDDVLYHSYSFDGLTWSAPKCTPYALGHAPDIVVLDPGTGSVAIFCVYRGARGFLRGGQAIYDTTTDTFWCEHEVLYTALGRGGGDFGYASAVRLNNTSVGFINYDVIDCCGTSGCAGMRGMITWQAWSKA